MDATVAQRTLEFIEGNHGQLMLHAGAVAAADGRVIVVHGASGSGKTTLTAALVAQGLAYVTDETVSLNPHTLAIEPFRKPLTVKPGSQELLVRLRPSAGNISAETGNWQVPATEVGGPELPGTPLAPAIIVFPRYSPDCETVQLERVGRARAAFVLGEQSSALWAIEPRPLAALARLVSVAPTHRATYPNAFEVASTLVTDFAALTEHDPTVDVLDSAQPIPTGDAGPRRADGVDWLLLDQEAVLFDGRHLHHLDPSGATVWLALDGQRALIEIAEEVAQAFDADPKVVLTDVEDLVRVLTSRGLARAGPPRSVGLR